MKRVGVQFGKNRKRTNEPGGEPMKLHAASAILEDTMHAEPMGGTYDRTTGDRVTLSAGYIVGGVYTRTVTIGQAFDYPSWVAREIASVANRGQWAPYVGTWADSGELHIDLVEIYSDRRHALMVARERGELAIWDCAAGEEIRVSY